MTPLRQVRKLRARRAPGGGGRRRAASSAGGATRRPTPDPVERSSDGMGRDPARQARRVRADAAHERRSARRDAQRRPGLEPDRRADGAAHGPAGQDLRRRLRGRRTRSCPTRGGWPSATARTTTSSRSTSTSDADELARLVWHLDEPLADLSSLGFLALCELARRARDRRAVRPGRRRAARRLPQAPRRLAGRALGAGCPRPLRAGRGAGAAPRPGPRRPARATRSRRGDPVARLLASSGLVHPDLRAGLFGGALAEHADAAEASSARPPRRRARRRARSRPRSTWTPGSASWTTCSPTSTVPRWPARSRSACRSSTTSSSSCARASPPSTRCAGCRASTCCAWPRGATCPDFVLEKRKRGFFNEAVGAWLGAGGGALVDELLLAPDPAYAARARPRRGRAARARVAGGPRCATRTCCWR